MMAGLCWRWTVFLTVSWSCAPAANGPDVEDVADLSVRSEFPVLHLGARLFLDLE